ncbi:MAG TPA: efflux RND transporter permease subunit [Balneolales bacterium]|nr:efflux RND transporter permease subunit [Balneolales bacterium]
MKVEPKGRFTENVLRRPITVIMITLMIIGFGIFSLSRLKVTMRPEFNIPVIAISTNYSDVSPVDMTRLIVEPIENAVSTVEGIQTIESHVHKGGAFIILRLNNGVDVKKVELNVREAIDRIRSNLPRQANEPVLFQFDPNSRPIMRLSVEAKNRGLDVLRRYATEKIEPQLERIDGVASADTRGGLQRTVYVDMNLRKLAQYHLMPSQVQNAISQNNQQVPVGQINTPHQTYSVRAQSIYQNIDQIKQTVIKTDSSGYTIHVADVADVKNTFQQLSTLVEVNGKNSVSVEIQKQSDANTLDVAQKVIAAIPAIKAQLPNDVSINVLQNEGTSIQNSISNLTESALMALAGVIIILFIFMGGWRSALVVAMSIPISITSTFAGMYFFHITLNIISITGLALAVGLLVDNSIVVTENIAIKMEEGESRVMATLHGTMEVTGAITGSTLTTLGVFVPILGIAGFVGMIAKDLALTICIAISISYFSAIILIPVLSSLLLRSEEFERESLAFRLIDKLKVYYERALKWLSGHKYYVILFVALLIVGTYMFFKTIPGEFFPQTDTGEMDVNIELPTGTKLVTTAAVLRKFTNEIRHNVKQVKTVVTQIGERGFTSETNLGQISITLTPADKRKVSTNDVAIRLRHMLSSPGVKVTIQTGGGGFGRFNGSGIQLSLIGPDISVLQAISNKIQQNLMQDPNVISVDNGRSDPTPELHFIANRRRINRLGTSLQNVAQTFMTDTRGVRVGYYRDEGRQIPIILRAQESDRSSLSDLENLVLAQPDSNQSVPLRAIGYFQSTEGYTQITRRDRENVLDININVKGNYQVYEKKITHYLKNNVALPDGYRFDFSGNTRNFGNSVVQLYLALLFALALVYMIMASQFENLRDPLVVMFTIPLAFFGSLFLLYVTGTSLSIPADIGVLILIGIVVNNGIVLVDYSHRYTREFEDEDTYLNNLIKAASRRMRPILLTAMTTIFSMIPLALAIGSGSEIWSPLARSVIGGLIFSTILTLFVIPILVILVSKDRRRIVAQNIEDEKNSGDNHS